MKFPLAFKIGVFAALLVTLIAWLVGVMVYRQAMALLIEHERVDLRDETRQG